MKMTMI